MKPLLALPFLVAMLLSGCSGGGDGGFVTPDQDAEGRYVVEMVGQKFSPKNIEVPVGSTVVWKFVSGGAHDVSGEGDAGFDSDAELGMRMNSADDEFTHTFTEEGTFSYYCEVHHAQHMEGQVRVVANTTA